MKGYLITIRCPFCDGTLEPVVSSKVIASTECSAIAKCTGCNKEWQTHVTLRPSPTMGALRAAKTRSRKAA